jgi:hypothetical protein
MKTLSILLTTSLLFGISEGLLAQSTSRASLSSSGGQLIGDTGGPSGRPFNCSVSGNGRFVAFSSGASGVVTGDTNLYEDVFVRDLLTDTTVRVSLSSAGAQGDGASFYPDISETGRFVSFVSLASSFFTGDGSFTRDIFVHDRDPDEDDLFDEGNGVTLLVSQSSAGVPGDDESGPSVYRPTISGDGRYVVFGSLATNFTTDDTLGEHHLYVRDRDPDGNGTFDEGNSTTTAVDVSDGGELANEYSNGGVISGNGEYIVFNTEADNVHIDADGLPRLYYRHLPTLTTTMVPTDIGLGVPLTGNWDFSANGDYLFMDTGDVSLFDTNGFTDVYSYSLIDGTWALISQDTTGVLGNSSSIAGQSSEDGRFVTFMSFASNLVSADSNSKTDIFLRDRDTDEDGIFDEAGAVSTVRVSTSTAGTEGTDPSQFPRISNDGSRIAFESGAPNLVSDDTNLDWDIFIHRTECISSWSNYGTGWPGFFGVPTLEMFPNPSLGQMTTFEFGNSQPMPTLGLVFAGFAEASIPFPGGATLLLTPSIVRLLPIPPGGLFLPYFVPLDDTLCDLTLYLQVMMDDPMALGGFAFTEGLKMTFGTN